VQNSPASGVARQRHDLNFSTAGEADDSSPPVDGDGADGGVVGSSEAPGASGTVSGNEAAGPNLVSSIIFDN
jgi:hypothetical protein